MKEGLSPSKPPSLPRTFPKSTRPYMAKICFAMFGRVLLGKVLCFWGGIFIWCGFAPVLCVGRIWRISFAWISYPTALPPPIGCDSRTLQKFPPPIQAQKLPHKTPTIKKAKQIFARVMVGVLWGSSGRLREVWREKEHPPKGGSFSLQGLPPLPPPRQPQNETVEEEEERGENESNHQNRGNRADAEQKSHR